MKIRFVWLLIFTLLAPLTVAPVNAKSDFNKSRTEVVERSSRHTTERTIPFFSPRKPIHFNRADHLTNLSEFKTHSVLVTIKSIIADTSAIRFHLRGHLLILPVNDEIPLG